MTSQRVGKQAQLVLAQAVWALHDSLYSDLLIFTNDHDITQASYDVSAWEIAALSAQRKQAATTIETAKANLGYRRRHRGHEHHAGVCDRMDP